MNTDDSERGRGGVIFSIQDLPGNKVRINMDEVSNKNFPSKGPWVDKGLVTWKDYDEKDFEEMNFSNKELQAIGSHVMAWLWATKKHPHK